MTVTALREKLHHCIDEADEKKLELIYSFFEEDFTGIPNAWDDPAFVEEMKSRIEEIESGADKGRDWNEIFEEVKATYAR